MIFGDTTEHSPLRGRTIGLECALIALVATAWLLPVHVVRADERRFTSTSEATTLPPGMAEYEQWYTWKTSKENDRGFDRHEFRHELEFGLTEDLQLALYVSDWRYHENKHRGQSEAEWRNIAVELIYNLTDPTEDFLGTALYGEVKIGDEFFELEGKFITQKNIGPIMLAHNAIIEAEWEDDDFGTDNGKLAQTFGASYQIDPSLSVGMELLHEFAIPDWAGIRGKSVLYLGPNLAFRQPHWWVTATPLFQVSDVEDEPDFQLRLLFGIILDFDAARQAKKEG